MRRKRWIFVAAPIGIVLFILIGGEVVMHLWNWLMPGLFGWKLLTFWQAFGLLALCRILFGGFGGRSHRPGWGWRMRERWEHMTPEEREKFRERVGSRCGGFRAPESENKGAI
jgi:Ca2+/H+ antiporter, TMEM165/GDT1 family